MHWKIHLIRFVSVRDNKNAFYNNPAATATKACCRRCLTKIRDLQNAAANVLQKLEVCRMLR
jgi:hypothetical protein